MTDGGSAYLNLGEDYDVQHNVVYHNRYFVNPQRVDTFVDKLGKIIHLKVHTNTIEGHWGNMKPYLKVKKGVGERLSH